MWISNFKYSRYVLCVHKSVFVFLIMYDNEMCTVTLVKIYQSLCMLVICKPPLAGVMYLYITRIYVL